MTRIPRLAHSRLAVDVLVVAVVVVVALSEAVLTFRSIASRRTR